MVKVIADEFLTDERERKYYADRYSCCPPPLFIIFITLVEVSDHHHCLFPSMISKEIGPACHADRHDHLNLIELPIFDDHRPGYIARVCRFCLYSPQTYRLSIWSIHP